MTFELRMIEFRVMTMAGSGAVEVILMGDELRHYHEEKTDRQRDLYVKHMAWRKLYDSEAGNMLRKLCNRFGVTYVKHKFNETSHIVEIARG